MNDVRPAAVVILAAGEGTRMRSGTPKVLHEICGRSLLGHIADAAARLNPEHIVFVVGHARERVSAHITDVIAPRLPDGVHIGIAVQAEQNGTGHAARCALDVLPELGGPLLLLNGDTPLLRTETLAALLATHVEGSRAATVLTAQVPDPFGLGRVLRDDEGNLAAIVEQRDATDAQRAITEINSGMFAFDAVALRTVLKQLTADNDQGQEYLTDAVALLRAAHGPAAVAALAAPDHRETLGCNDRVELAGLRALLRDRLAERWMREGVTMVDPATVWLDVDVELARDVVVEPNTQLLGATRVDEGATVGPDSTLRDCVVGAGASVVRTHGESSSVGPNATVGPFAFLRPGTSLGAKGKIGAYVEVKNSQIGDSSKVPHLSYVGDATIGEHTNIGAATVFVNYDGVRKHRTVIGSHCRTGSDNMFVAPVTVGDGAYTAAGSVITMDVPPGALAVARAEQRNIEGWVQRRRSGTPAAEAAARARADHDENTDTHQERGG